MGVFDCGGSTAPSFAGDAAPLELPTDRVEGPGPSPDDDGPEEEAIGVTNALGKSGVPEAKPHIDGALPLPDKDVRRWAARALKYWMISTGQMSPDADLPSGWPYGQPGYPPPLPEERDEDDDD
mgnify:CR=1 FL=1